MGLQNKIFMYIIVGFYTKKTQITCCGAVIFFGHCGDWKGTGSLLNTNHIEMDDD